MLRRTLAALAVLVTTGCAEAQSPVQMKDVEIPRIDRRPLLDEFLDGHARPDMKRIDDFRQRSPGDGVPVSRKTSAWIGYDDKNLYAVFVCEALPGSTRARLSKREDVFADDIVGIFLDTYHDRRRAYEFLVNPFGVQADALITEGQDDDFSFDTIWYSEGRLTSYGYTASIAIPFKSLRFSTGGSQTWGLGLARLIPDNNEASFWPFVTQKVSGFTQQLGGMTGLENIAPGRNLRIAPYGSFSRGHFLDNPSVGVPGFRSQTGFRGGFDAKAVIHGSLTLDVAVNPDFSQVESDDPQVTANQRFEVQFPEKRPFFLENNGYFGTPENLFFSRRISDPEYGARLTGKIGSWSIGVLGIDDRAPAGAAPGDRAAIGVARIQREFGEQSRVGILITDREFAGHFNRVAAIDTRLKLTDNWTFTGQAIVSRTEDRGADRSAAPAAVRSGGDAFNLELNGQNRKWNYDFHYTDRSEGFQADLGFIQRVNIREAQQFLARHFRPESKTLLSWSPQLYLMGDFDHRNVQQDWTVRPELNIELARETNFSVFHSETFERFDNINFRHHDNGFSGHTEYFRRAAFDVNYARGTRINFDAPTGLPVFLGHGSDFSATITVRPLSRMKLDEIYYLTGLYTSPGVAADSPARAVFLDHLARSRVNYQFTRELSLRLIIDYNAVLQNPELIHLERQKRITGDVLLTYLIHPGTAFYIGYTDRLENVGLTGGGAPGMPATLSRIGFPSTTTGRQFFAKLTYQFRF